MTDPGTPRPLPILSKRYIHACDAGGMLYQQATYDFLRILPSCHRCVAVHAYRRAGLTAGLGFSSILQAREGSNARVCVVHKRRFGCGRSVPGLVPWSLLLYTNTPELLVDYMARCMLMMGPLRTGLDREIG